MLKHFFNFCKNLGSRIKDWTKPTTITLVTASLTDMTRGRADLIAENAMLRQQLIVLNRQVKRPHLTNADRLRLVLLARGTRFWQQALHIVQPDTLLRWHRDLFRLYWRFKSRKKNRSTLSLFCRYILCVLSNILPDSSHFSLSNRQVVVK